MKIGTLALLSSAVATSDAMNLRSLFSHSHNSDNAAAEPTNAVEPAANNANEQERDLQTEQVQTGNCWHSASSSPPDAAWHPVYAAGWTNGYCAFKLDCNSPSYSSQLACCKGAYGGQISGYCLNQLPSPPTTSPTTGGGLDVWYPDYETPWSEAGCRNDRPMPSGRPTYSSMLACCKGAYAGQVSGKCISMLPSPPTSSPTTSDFDAGFWYPDYDTQWSDAGCSNKLPLPYNNVNDRPNYKTQLACCKGAYGGQTSGVCLSQLPSPPTTSPTGTGGYDFWYPMYSVSWDQGYCDNSRPLPFTPGGRPTYSTQLACCKGAYGGQVSGACISGPNGLPNPPTSSPTSVNEYGYVPDRSTSPGVCTKGSKSNNEPSKGTELECCEHYYGWQLDDHCACGVDPCYSQECTGTGAWADGATKVTFTVGGRTYEGYTNSGGCPLLQKAESGSSPAVTIFPWTKKDITTPSPTKNPTPKPTA